MNYNSIIVGFRNFYQKYINSSFISFINEKNPTVLLCNADSNSEHKLIIREKKVVKPIYIFILNYPPFFISKYFLNYFQIEYLYKIDDIIRLSSINEARLSPIIISFKIVDNTVLQSETDNYSLDLVPILKKYDCNVPLNFIIENEILEKSESKFEYNFFGINLFEIVYNGTDSISSEFELKLLKILYNNTISKQSLNCEAIYPNIRSDLINSFDPVIQFKIIKNGIIQSKEINYKKNKFGSIFELLNLDIDNINEYN